MTPFSYDALRCRLPPCKKSEFVYAGSGKMSKKPYFWILFPEFLNLILSNFIDITSCKIVERANEQSRDI